ncbi:MFS transporter [Streptomyces sp. NK08204]|uniref:MFS transporter n=1 Tax=Streptomyces sp. NK08204 TaxID=2873260 RepID=UPI001CEC83C5|nr:MFS transporter [Streptomyces sp. NK08204]
MRHLWRRTLSFPPAVRLLMANQFLINLAFYMLMPYLAAHLAGELGLAAWAVGLVLGVRNFSQQGMFLIGGTLADRVGYKIPIMAGCLLRTAGFGLLGWVGDLPTLVAASAATGFAGALFNPAVRAYLAAEAGPRRVEAFAVFNVFYQAGMLLGPPVGLALLVADFRLVCGVAAAVFALLTALQWRCLPARRAERAASATGRAGVLSDWRTVVANRPFLLFATAMTGSYVLSFQVYLALPLAASEVLGSGGTAVTSGLFVVSAAVSAAGQLRLTGWAGQRWRPDQALVRGLSAMGLAFLPPALVPAGSAPAALGALLLSVVLLAVGGAIVYPFEMDTVVTLSGDRLVATHYGFYNTVSGIGITIGNLGTGALWGFAGQHGARWLAWSALAVTGLGCAACVGRLARTGRLTVRPGARPVTV